MCSDSQAALEALQDVKTTSALVRQCQKALDDISTYHSVGLFWVPGHSGIRGNEIADDLAREGSAHHFVGSEPAVGVSRQCIRRKIQCWMNRQHLVGWRGLVGTMRQAQELISGPNNAARTALMSFNGAQSRVVIGLLTGHYTLRRHLHIMGLVDSPLCRKCRAGEGTSAHVLCEFKALATLRHIYLGSFYLDPENVRDLSLRTIWNFFRRTGLLWLGSNEGAQRICEGLCATGPWGLDPHLLITHEVLLYVFLSKLPDMQMETPWRQIIFNHPWPVLYFSSSSSFIYIP
jgi:hypothetical protein